MTTNINFTQNSVAGTSVAEPDANGTLSTTNGSNQLVFITPIISQKGRPNEIIALTASNWQSKLGKPYHPSQGANSDGLRVLSEALVSATGYGIRVVPSTASYPAIKVKKGENNAITIVNEAINYSEELSLHDNEIFAIAIKDGANSDNRTLSLTPADEKTYGKNMLSLSLVETDSIGTKTVLETQVVSFDTEAKDSMGADAFIDSVLENSSTYLESVTDSDQALKLVTKLADTAFTGASNGSINDIKTTDFDRAIELIDTTNIAFNCINAFGIYDTDVHKSLIALQNKKRLMGFYDLDPRQNYAQALKQKIALALDEKRAAYYQFPYTARCPFNKVRAMWGISGIVTSGMAKGLAKSSPTAGWHYSPAGEERTLISRTNVAPMKGMGVPDEEAMYTARLNKLGKNKSGNLYVDDSLTSSVREDYLRFIHAVAVIDSITRDFNELTNTIKHNPDDETNEALTDGIESILDGYVDSGALVTPRNADDGKEPYIYSITQTSFDSWEIVWSVCVTGTGRRFHGKPVLLR